MRKNVIALLAGVLLVPLSLAGCSMQENGSPTHTTTPTPSPSATNAQESDLPKITYVVVGGDGMIFRMYVLTPDYTVKRYDLNLEYYNQYDFFAGELPPEGEYRVDKYQISEENWNALVGAINENNFAELPEELPEDEEGMPVLDGTTYYIQVETSDGVHKSGGYEAGRWDDKENKRFRAIQEKLDSITEAR